MCIKRFASNFGRIAAVAFLFFNSVGCSTQAEQIDVPTVASDAPLSVFILGDWHSTEVQVESGYGTTDFQYKILFETESVVKFIVIYPEGDTEGYTFTYNFITQDSIYVDNKHLAGGETWYLEKRGEDLVVRRETSIGTTKIVLERIK